METQSFSLSGRAERVSIIGNSVFYVGLASMGVRVSWHEPVYRYLWIALLVFTSVGQWCRYKADVSSRLEVSDEGLVRTAWPQSVERIAWNEVAQVRMWQDPGRQSESAIVRDTHRHSISVPGTSENSAEILRILRQRLPQDVFEKR